MRSHRLDQTAVVWGVLAVMVTLGLVVLLAVGSALFSRALRR